MSLVVGAVVVDDVKDDAAEDVKGVVVSVVEVTDVVDISPLQSQSSGTETTV